MLGSRAAGLIWGASAMKIPQGTLVAPYPVAILGQPMPTRHPWSIPDLLDSVRDASPEQRGIWTPPWHHLLTLPGTPHHPCTSGPSRRALHPAQNPALSWASGS